MSASAFINGAVDMIQILWPVAILVAAVAFLCYRYRGVLAQ